MKKTLVDKQYRIAVRPVLDVVIEGSGKSWSAHAPAFPGCIATGRTLEETQRNIEDALAFLFEEMQRVEDAEAARAE